ncbi:hypothetical protein SPHINGO361_70174 [Sphingomonas sp. EC-HK361]|nr:hypothetical protein SPHINGO361_70174 [Sphingomonas sp. EC-HK361]
MQLLGMGAECWRTSRSEAAGEPGGDLHVGRVAVQPARAEEIELQIVAGAVGDRKRGERLGACTLRIVVAKDLHFPGERHRFGDLPSDSRRAAISRVPPPAVRIDRGVQLGRRFKLNRVRQRIGHRQEDPRAPIHRRAPRPAVHGGGRRQWHRADQPCRPRLVPGHRGRAALHRAGQGAPELVEGPQQNGFVESFDGRLRGECLNEHLFHSLAAARRIIEAWRTDYDTVHQHSSLGGMAPAEFTNRPRQGHENTETNYQRPENGEIAGREWSQRLVLLFACARERGRAFEDCSCGVCFGLSVVVAGTGFEPVTFRL